VRERGRFRHIRARAFPSPAEACALHHDV